MDGFWQGFQKHAMKEVSTVAIIDVDGRKLLMGKRRDNQKWTTPGGHLDKGEKPIKGIMRETFEESGIRIDEDDIIHVKSKTINKYTPKGPGEKMRVHAYKVFFGSDWLPSTTVRHDPDREVNGWRWVPMTGGLPKDIQDNLHVPLGKNVLLDNLDFSDPDEILKPSQHKGMAS